jgi:hypothetical protein
VDASRTGKPRPEGAAPSLEALATPFVKENNSSNAERLYWYSQRMVEQLLHRNANFVHFREFIQSMQKQDVDRALEQYYGVSAQQLYDESR